MDRRYRERETPITCLQQKTMANTLNMGNDKIIEVRPATLDDYRSVLDIDRNVYDGADYVTNYYHDLINDPDFHYYVCMVDGEVGAFEGVCVVDDGDTLMTRTARVKDKFQGLGLLRHIRKRIYEDFKSAPGKKRIRTSCTNLVRLVDSKRFRQANRTLAKLDLMGFDVFGDVPESVLALSPADYSAVVEVTLTQFSQLLDDRELMDYLYPQGIVTTMSWFFDTRSSNARHLEKLSAYVVASKSILEFSKRDSKPGSGADGNTGNPSGFLGIMSYYASPTVFLANFDITGGISSGEKEKEEGRQLIGLFLRHLDHRHKEELPGSKIPMCFGVDVRGQRHVELFQEILKDYGFTREEEVVTKYTHQYFFEQSFEQLLQ